ncbi:baculoviral IAP repeat-containing protein 1b-like [Xenopus laevis]|uniref:Baculoviral IAP repeat-containing protein 1b-like n=1 Tax=Xenopus laevis TaxID=8355 RepID=A0A8J1L7S2_XENLA|nr:baculoviral IAP repeat-containing protein 1b-like [Xenopus laevis]
MEPKEQQTDPGDQAIDAIINEYDTTDLMGKFKNMFPFISLNFQKFFDVKNQEHAAIRQAFGKGYKFEMRSEARRLQSFLSLKQSSLWCPKAMARAGFYFTGVDVSVQCFCCGLVICTGSIQTLPLESHTTHNPCCGFLQGKDVGNIPKYEIRVQKPEVPQRDLQEYAAEESRLNSFKDWPFYARIQPDKLSAAGFIFTGEKA